LPALFLPATVRTRHRTTIHYAKAGTSKTAPLQKTSSEFQPVPLQFGVCHLAFVAVFVVTTVKMNLTPNLSGKPRSGLISFYFFYFWWRFTGF
jgi:hypothetical protein